jgi:allantoin racemase
MEKRILYIKPSAYDTMDAEIKRYLEKYKDKDTEVDVVSMPRGPKHLEYLYYQSIAYHEILKTVERAEKDGYNAAVIGCFDDPGLYPAREISETMFVTGPGEASMLIAATLGGSFSIIVGCDKWIPQMRDNVRKYGSSEKLASFRSLGLGVLDFRKDPAFTAKRMRQEIQRAINEDKAEVILLGCTMEFGFFEELQGQFGVPVIDVMLAAFKYAEFLAGLKQKMNWFTSKVLTFASPPAEQIRGWNIPADYNLGDIWD